jgi:hypothetical protein
MGYYYSWLRIGKKLMTFEIQLDNNPAHRIWKVNFILALMKTNE